MSDTTPPPDGRPPDIPSRATSTEPTPDTSLPGELGGDAAPTEVEQRLRHAARLETVGQLAAGFAHELGTPLNVILGRARMISRRQVEGDAAVESAEIIIGQARRMAELVRHLLTFARRRPSPTTRLDLAKVVEGARALLAPVAHKRRASLDIELPEARCISPGDAGALEQMLANVVMNAIDAMPLGGAVRLRLDRAEGTHPRTGAEGPWHTIRVSDQGPGIPPEVRERVFEPFFTTKDVGEGTGLGLSVAYGIVRDHGGWIDIAEAEPDRGAEVTIWLPIAESEATP